MMFHRPCLAGIYHVSLKFAEGNSWIATPQHDVVAASGTVTLHLMPIATFPHQRHANVYRYSYAFTAAGSDGAPIEQRFDQDVLITFGYDDAELRRMGLSEQWIEPACFSTSTDSWTFSELRGRHGKQHGGPAGRPLYRLCAVPGVRAPHRALIPQDLTGLL